MGAYRLDSTVLDLSAERNLAVHSADVAQYSAWASRVEGAGRLEQLKTAFSGLVHDGDKLLNWGVFRRLMSDDGATINLKALPEGDPLREAGLAAVAGHNTPAGLTEAARLHHLDLRIVAGSLLDESWRPVRSLQIGDALSATMRRPYEMGGDALPTLDQALAKMIGEKEHGFRAGKLPNDTLLQMWLEAIGQ